MWWPRLGHSRDISFKYYSIIPDWHSLGSRRDRKHRFFKPAQGYASKAAYRGDKLTRRVWSEITAGNYIAQAYADPGLRGVQLDGARVELNVDVRLYTYEGKVLLTAARLYRGQTTNMRTPGGGFAPVLVAP